MAASVHSQSAVNYPPAGLSGRETAKEAELLEIQALQAEREGDDTRCVQLMERALQIRSNETSRLGDTINSRGSKADQQMIDSYTNMSQDLYDAAERFVVKCNSHAVQSFKNGDFDTATPLLQYGLQMTEESTYPLREVDARRVHLRGVTLNNLGCMKRRQGQFTEALQFLQDSMQTTGEESPVAYMNMSAILIQLRLSEEAAQMAQRAIELLSNTPEDPSLLAVAHHNYAMSLEPVDVQRCLQEYETAYQLACASLGEENASSKSILRNWQRYQQAHRRPGDIGAGSFFVAAKRAATSNNKSDSQMQTPRPGSSSKKKDSPLLVDDVSDIFPHPFFKNNQAALPDADKATSSSQATPMYRPGPVSRRPLVPLSTATTKRSPSESRQPPASSRFAASSSGSPAADSRVAGAARRGQDNDNSSPAGGAHSSSYSAARGKSTNPRRRASTDSDDAPMRRKPNVRGVPPVLRPAANNNNNSSNNNNNNANSSSGVNAKGGKTGNNTTASRTSPTSRLRRGVDNNNDSEEDTTRDRPIRGGANRSSVTGANNSGPTKPGTKMNRLTPLRQKEQQQQQQQKDQKESQRDQKDESSSRYQIFKKREINESGTAPRRPSQLRPLPPLQNKNNSTSQSEHIERSTFTKRSSSNAGPGASATGQRKTSQMKNSQSYSQTAPLQTSTSSKNLAKSPSQQQQAFPVQSSTQQKQATLVGTVKELTQFERSGGDLNSYISDRLEMLLHDEEELERKYTKAVAIQRHYRGHLARRTVQDMKNNRVRDQQVRELRRNMAARTIQQAYRSSRRTGVRRAARYIRGTDHIAAIRLQRVARGWLARRHYARMLHYHNECDGAATRVQTWYRSQRARRNLVRMREEKNASDMAARTQERKDYAATRIQSAWRSYKDYMFTLKVLQTRRTQRKRETAERNFNAARTIQCAWRSARARERYEDLLALKEGREAERWEYLRRRKAAIKLQSLARGMSVRRNIAPELDAARLRVAKIINRNKETSIAASKIQRAFRAHRARVELASMREKYADAQWVSRSHVLSALVQRVGRGYVARRALGIDLLNMANEALRYQQKMEELARHDALDRFAEKASTLLVDEDDYRAEIQMDEMKFRRRITADRNASNPDASRSAPDALKTTLSPPVVVAADDDDAAAAPLNGFAKIIKAKKAVSDLQEKREEYLVTLEEEEAAAIVEEAAETIARFVRASLAKSAVEKRAMAVMEYLDRLEAEDKKKSADRTSTGDTRPDTAKEIEMESAKLDDLAQTEAMLSDQSPTGSPVTGDDTRPDTAKEIEMESEKLENLTQTEAILSDIVNKGSPLLDDTRPNTAKQLEEEAAQLHNLTQTESILTELADERTTLNDLHDVEEDLKKSDQKGGEPRVATRETSPVSQEKKPILTATLMLKPHPPTKRPAPAASSPTEAKPSADAATEDDGDVNYEDFSAAMAALRHKRAQRLIAEDNQRREREEMEEARQAFRMKKIEEAGSVAELAQYSARSRLVAPSKRDKAKTPEMTEAVELKPSSRQLRITAASRIIYRFMLGHRDRQYARKVRALRDEYLELLGDKERLERPTLVHTTLEHYAEVYPHRERPRVPTPPEMAGKLHLLTTPRPLKVDTPRITAPAVEEKPLALPAPTPTPPPTAPPAPQPPIAEVAAKLAAADVGPSPALEDTAKTDTMPPTPTSALRDVSSEKDARHQTPEHKKPSLFDVEECSSVMTSELPRPDSSRPCTAIQIQQEAHRLAKLQHDEHTLEVSYERQSINDIKHQMKQAIRGGVTEDVLEGFSKIIRAKRIIAELREKRDALLAAAEEADAVRRIEEAAVMLTRFMRAAAAKKAVENKARLILAYLDAMEVSDHACKDAEEVDEKPSTSSASSTVGPVERRSMTESEISHENTRLQDLIDAERAVNERDLSACQPADVGASPPTEKSERHVLFSDAPVVVEHPTSSSNDVVEEKRVSSSRSNEEALRAIREAVAKGEFPNLQDWEDHGDFGSPTMIDLTRLIAKAFDVEDESEEMMSSGASSEHVLRAIRAAVSRGQRPSLQDWEEQDSMSESIDGIFQKRANSESAAEAEMTFNSRAADGLPSPGDSFADESQEMASPTVAEKLAKEVVDDFINIVRSMGPANVADAQEDDVDPYSPLEAHMDDGDALEARQIVAAVTIQSAYRRYSASKELSRLRTAQRDRRDADLEAEEILHGAATDVQRVFRGYQGRLVARACRDARERYLSLLMAKSMDEESCETPDSFNPPAHAADGSTIPPEAHEDRGLTAQDVNTVAGPTVYQTRPPSATSSTARLEEVGSNNSRRSS